MLDAQVQQFERRRIAPVHILENNQHRHFGCQVQPLRQKHREHFFFALLRTEFRARAAGIEWHRQQVGEQEERFLIAQRARELSPELCKLGRRRLIGVGSERPLHLAEHRKEDAVDMVRRAEIPQASMRLGAYPGLQRAPSRHGICRFRARPS